MTFSTFHARFRQIHDDLIAARRAVMSGGRLDHAAVSDALDYLTAAAESVTITEHARSARATLAADTARRIAALPEATPTPQPRGRPWPPRRPARWEPQPPYWAG